MPVRPVHASAACLAQAAKGRPRGTGREWHGQAPSGCGRVVEHQLRFPRHSDRFRVANCEYEPRLPVARFRHPGLLMQPVTGHMSDRTWIGRLVRRRPYFLLGAPACRPARWALYGAVQHPCPGATIAGRDGDGIDHEGFLSRRTDQDHGLCSGTLILAAIASIRVRMWQLRRAISRSRSSVTTLRKARIHLSNAIFAIAQITFALAAWAQISEKEPAFQASSPKNFKGLVFGSAFFLARTTFGLPLFHILMVTGSRQRANQLIEAHFILRACHECQANPIQTPCQKQHGPLPSFSTFSLYLRGPKEKRRNDAGDTY